MGQASLADPDPVLGSQALKAVNVVITVFQLSFAQGHIVSRPTNRLRGRNGVWIICCRDTAMNRIT